MGNPSLKQPHPTQPAPAAEAGNGVLGRVPGDIVGAAGRQLPPAREGELKQREVVVDVPDLGRVRITYRLASHKRRSMHWFWNAERADRDL